MQTCIFQFTGVTAHCDECKPLESRNVVFIYLEKSACTYMSCTFIHSCKSQSHARNIQKQHATPFNLWSSWSEGRILDKLIWQNEKQSLYKYIVTSFGMMVQFIIQFASVALLISTAFAVIKLPT